MNTLILLGCGAAKREGPAPAVDLYTGSLYRKSLAYARKLGGPHFILSALHGVVSPERVLVPYDNTLADRSTRASWAQWVGTDLLDRTVAGDELVVLAGRRYWGGWAPRLRTAGRIVTTPLAGMGMGARMHWLTEQVM